MERSKELEEDLPTGEQEPSRRALRLRGCEPHGNSLCRDLWVWMTGGGLPSRPRSAHAHFCLTPPGWHWSHDPA